MSDVKSIIFGSSTETKICLFECAKFWSSEGKAVVYISICQHNYLPPEIQGNGKLPPIHAFKNISFLAVPTLQDLLRYLCNFHNYAKIPNVIIVEDMHKYCECDKQIRNPSAVLCASLLDAANYSSHANHCTTYLILSSDLTSKLTEIFNLILSPYNIWQVHKGNPNITGDIVLTADSELQNEVKRILLLKAGNNNYSPHCIQRIFK